MKIIVLGDVYGKIGRELIKEKLPELKKFLNIDFVIANVENTTNGKGISKKHYLELKKNIDVMTSGNHIFSLEETREFISETKDLLRPLNSNPYHPGIGSTVINLKNKKIRITNLIGVNFMPFNSQNPYYCFEKLLKNSTEDYHLVDFHAETTGEKIMFANYFDGKITALWGTHTHVQTNDERILEKGTGFITDVGMTGSLDGIIGANPKDVINRTKYSFANKLNPFYEGKKQINAIVLELEDKENKLLKIEKIKKIYL